MFGIERASGNAGARHHDAAPRNGRQLDRIPNERLRDQIAELASHVYAGTCRWLELVAELDRREAWDASGCRSCAEWLAWRCALGSRAAREHVRVARRLCDLPVIHERFGRGELSYAKVRALTRVAEPDSEAELVEVAEHATAAQLERIVRAYRRVSVREANDAHEDRSLAWFWEQDGALAIHGRIAGEDAALVHRALEAARAELWEEAHREERGSAEPREDGAGAGGGSAEPPPEPRQTNADALVRVAEASLGSGPASRSGADRAQVIVHVDQRALTRDRGERCEVDGVAIAPEAARRLACDAAVVPILESDGEALSVGRKRRTIPPPMRRALEARDATCRFPGCESRRFVDAHHLTHWAHGGETRLDNLLLLCRRHHRLVHEGGLSVGRGRDGEVRFRDRWGREIEPVPRLPRARPRTLDRANVKVGRAIDRDTCMTGTGERIDFGLAVEQMASIADR